MSLLRTINGVVQSMISKDTHSFDTLGTIPLPKADRQIRVILHSRLLWIPALAGMTGRIDLPSPQGQVATCPYNRSGTGPHSRNATVGNAYHASLRHWPPKTTGRMYAPPTGAHRNHAPPLPPHPKGRYHARKNRDAIFYRGLFAFGATRRRRGSESEEG